MKIRSLVSLIQGPDGTARKGEVIDIEDKAVAKSLIAQGKAEAVTDDTSPEAGEVAAATDKRKARA